MALGQQRKPQCRRPWTASCKPSVEVPRRSRSQKSANRSAMSSHRKGRTTEHRMTLVRTPRAHCQFSSPRLCRKRGSRQKLLGLLAPDVRGATRPEAAATSQRHGRHSMGTKALNPRHCQSRALDAMVLAASLPSKGTATARPKARHSQCGRTAARLRAAARLGSRRRAFRCKLSALHHPHHLQAMAAARGRPWCL